MAPTTEQLGLHGTGTENDDDSNALILPALPKKKKNQKNNRKEPKTPRLSKSQQRKLKKLQEEKVKKEKSVEVLATLQKYKLEESAYALLQASGTRGQRESLREKLRRAINYERAGLQIPSDIPLLRERKEDNEDEIKGDMEYTKSNRGDKDMPVEQGQTTTLNNKTPSTNNYQNSETKVALSSKILEGNADSMKEVARSPKKRKKQQQEHKRSNVGNENKLDTEEIEITKCEEEKMIHPLSKKKKKKKQHKQHEIISPDNQKHENGSETCSEKSHEECEVSDSNKRKKKKKKRKGNDGADSGLQALSSGSDHLNKGRNTKRSREEHEAEKNNDNVDMLSPSKTKRQQNTSNDAGISDLIRTKKLVVHVSRTEEVENVRKNLPIIMMEQEIMEAIGENPVSIICGETGCGKTTQVPQFLYEAGFSSGNYPERSGMIGVTQPRRVAVLATAKRLAYEMNLNLGEEVGFQVRHDRKVGDSTRIKFMTDGILLRELQSDFLLRKYSVIVLDEAHERSLNTDVLIGMLSRVLPLRQNMYEEQCKCGKPSIFPLKLVIMSATLRVDEFISNKQLFKFSPPVVKVPARQFPVTVHFSAKTELVDYVGKAYKKVCAIHKNLPAGGVLIFLTGQAEVHYLCRRLQKAFPKQDKNKQNNDKPDTDNSENTIDQLGDDLSDIDFDEQMENFENFDAADMSDGSSSESDLEFEQEDGETHSWEGTQKKDESEWSVDGGGIKLDAIRDAFDALSGSSDKKSECPEPALEKHGATKTIGPLHVLPLYALLPASSQLKVFGNVPDGSRLVVVATNVAETSITIPGIRYVVDCGRVKEKMFERSSGITRYEVTWISKASAAQRAGRAGRTGPGHCYRLYSSAVYNDQFPEFSQPEIYRSPIEGLVLQLKCMGIVKVNNFPFLSQPDKQTLKEAEDCLQALSALDPESGLLTPLGKAISVYPIGPRHSRMLLTAMQIGCSTDVKLTNILLAYATAAVAALSLDNPFMTDVTSCDPKSTEDNITEQDTTSNTKKSAKAHSSHLKFRNHLSDALSVVRALRAYEMSKDPEEFCSVNNLHSRILYEMSKLRKQLIQIYLLVNKNKEMSSYSGLTASDIEATWKSLGNEEMSLKLDKILRQAICAGWADRVARKVSLQERGKTKEEDDHRQSRGVKYQCCSTQETVSVHPTSALKKSAPEFVVYNELVSTSRIYMKMVTSIDVNWLVLHSSNLCNFSKPLADPAPWYDPDTDEIYCWVSPIFGPHSWPLPLQKFTLKSKKHRVAVFASALLQGKVIPAMADLVPNLAASPTILLSPSGHAHKRVSELLHVLEVAAVDSRKHLLRMWEKQHNFLYQELLLWIQKKSHSQLERIWANFKAQAQQCGSDLVAKKKRKASTY